FFFLCVCPTTDIFTLSLHDALPIFPVVLWRGVWPVAGKPRRPNSGVGFGWADCGSGLPVANPLRVGTSTHRRRVDHPGGCAGIITSLVPPTPTTETSPIRMLIAGSRVEWHDLKPPRVGLLISHLLTQPIRLFPQVTCHCWPINRKILGSDLFGDEGFTVGDHTQCLRCRQLDIPTLASEQILQLLIGEQLMFRISVGDQQPHQLHGIACHTTTPSSSCCCGWRGVYAVTGSSSHQ